MIDFELVAKIACRLQAISNFAYDIHYNARGKDFYENHLFAERLGDQEGTADFKDEIFETVFLGRGQGVPNSKDIENGVVALTPTPYGEEEKDYKLLRGMISACLVDIESLDGLSLGEGDLFGRIASVLQRHNGLLFARLRYDENEVVDNSENEDEAWKNLMNNSKIKFFTTEDGAKIPLKNGETPEQAITRIKKEKEDRKKKYKENLEPKEINGKKKEKNKKPENIKNINPDGYKDNCSICSLATELSVRGYDVKAGKGDEYTSAELKEMFFGSEGNRLKNEKETKNEQELFEHLDNSIKNNERYLLNFYPLKTLGTEGHVVNIYKNNGKLEIYDSQIDKRFDKSYFSRIDFENRHRPEIYRIDNKAVNSKYFKYLK